MPGEAIPEPNESATGAGVGGIAEAARNSLTCGPLVPNGSPERRS